MTVNYVFILCMFHLIWINSKQYHWRIPRENRWWEEVGILYHYCS